MPSTVQMALIPAFAPATAAALAAAPLETAEPDFPAPADAFTQGSVYQQLQKGALGKGVIA